MHYKNIAATSCWYVCGVWCDVYSCARDIVIRERRVWKQLFAIYSASVRRVVNCIEIMLYIHIFICVTSIYCFRSKTNTYRTLTSYRNACEREQRMNKIFAIRQDHVIQFFFFFSFDNVRLNNINVYAIWGPGCRALESKAFTQLRCRSLAIHILYRDDPHPEMCVGGSVYKYCISHSEPIYLLEILNL